MNDLNVENFFPSQIYYGNIDLPLMSSIEESLVDVYKRSTSDIVWQSNNLKMDTRFDILKDVFKSSCLKILDNQGYSLQYHDFYVSSLWAQELKKGGGHAPHVHPGSIMSGLLFVDNKTLSSFPFFQDSRSIKKGFDLPLKDPNELSVANSFVNTKQISSKGSILIFNSYLLHGLVENSSELPVKFIHLNLSCLEK